MAMTDRTRQLLHDLQAHELSDAELVESIREILAARTREDQFLDFKSGLWLDDSSTAARDDLNPKERLRKWIAGFANADGGTLIVGIKEPPNDQPDQVRPVDGCADKAPDLKAWTARSLGQVASLASPYPVIRTVSVENQVVLVISVLRAPQLIPCYVKGREVHYIRNGDATIELTPTLYVDLALGRRSRPQIRMLVTASFRGGPLFRLELHVELINESIIALERAQVGVVARQRNPPMPDMVPRSLREQIDAGGRSHWKGEELGTGVFGPTPMNDENVGPTELGAFAVSHLYFQVPIVESSPAMEWHAAFFASGRNLPPTWHQVVCLWGNAHSPETRQAPVRHGTRPRIWFGPNTDEDYVDPLPEPTTP